jgi:lipopolysaccharide export system permease protein
VSLLAGYIVRRVLLSFLVATVAVGSLLWLLQMLDRLEDGLSGAMDILIVALQSMLAVPEALIDLLPVITILATAAAMSGFQARNELTIMRAAGVSIWRVTGVVLIPGFGVALLALAALQWVIPNVQQGPERLLGQSLGESGLWHPWHGLWVRKGDEFLNVQSLRLGRIPTGVDVYQFSADGPLQRHISADRALVKPDGRWRLEKALIRDYSAPRSEYATRHDELVWESFLSARQLELLLRPPASLPLADLWRYVRGLKERNQEVAEFEMVLWRRLALPLACLGMVLAAMATAAVPLKSRAVSVRLVAAMALGLGFQMLSEVSSYVGLVMAWPVPVVALMPPLLLSALAWWLLAKAR